MFLNMDQHRDELIDSNVKGKNPFKDVRVRRAVALAIDMNAIRDRIMGGTSRNAGIMVAPGINGYDKALDERPPPISTRRRSFSPRPATRAASRSGWIAPTTATSMTRRSARRSSACSAAPASG
jgi:ABC-type oligopeptide transport system substrate-binding subunit